MDEQIDGQMCLHFHLCDTVYKQSCLRKKGFILLHGFGDLGIWPLTPLLRLTSTEGGMCWSKAIH